VSTRYASRKFILALVGLALATFLRWRGLLDDESTTTIIITALLGYPAANVAEAALAPKAKADKEPAP